MVQRRAQCRQDDRFVVARVGLPSSSSPLVRQQYFEPLDLAQLWDLMADTLWSFRLFFFYFLERSWLDLRGKDFTFVIPTTGPPRNWRWTWSISEVLASFRVRQWRKWSLNDFTFGPCGGKCLVFCFVGNNFFCSLFFDKHVRDFTFCWLCLWSETF